MFIRQYTYFDIVMEERLYWTVMVLVHVTVVRMGQSFEEDRWH